MRSARLPAALHFGTSFIVHAARRPRWLCRYADVSTSRHTAATRPDCRTTGPTPGQSGEAQRRAENQKSNSSRPCPAQAAVAGNFRTSMPTVTEAGSNRERRCGETAAPTGTTDGRSASRTTPPASSASLRPGTGPARAGLGGPARRPAQPQRPRRHRGHHRRLRQCLERPRNP